LVLLDFRSLRYRDKRKLSVLCVFHCAASAGWDTNNPQRYGEAVTAAARKLKSKESSLLIVKTGSMSGAISGWDTSNPQPNMKRGSDSSSKT
jgi:hypothetical protein